MGTATGLGTSAPVIPRPSPQALVAAASLGVSLWELWTNPTNPGIADAKD